MKIDWKAKETRVAVTVFVTVVAIILFSRFLDDIDSLLGIVNNVCSEGMTLLMPYIMGASVCYILLPLVKFIDSKLLRRLIKWDGVRRGLSVLLTYLIVLAAIAWLLSYLVPILITNVQDFAKNLPRYIATAEALTQRLMDELPDLQMPAVEKAVESMLQNASAAIENYVEVGLQKAVEIVPAAIKAVAGTITDTFIAFIVSIYLLLDMERIKVSAQRMTRALFSEKSADRIFLFVHDADRIFGQYIRARVVTSVLVFLLTFVGFTVYGVPYATLFALVAAITNIIPFFGPIIGFLIIVPLVLLISPDKAIYAGVYITVLQQLEGYIIDPMIMGDSVDLRPFWVLLAVSVGGAFGLTGMVLGVPVAAFIGTQLSRYTAFKVGPKPEQSKKGLFRRKKKQ